MTDIVLCEQSGAVRSTLLGDEFDAATGSAICVTCGRRVPARASVSTLLGEPLKVEFLEHGVKPTDGERLIYHWAFLSDRLIHLACDSDGSYDNYIHQTAEGVWIAHGPLSGTDGIFSTDSAAREMFMAAVEERRSIVSSRATYGNLF